MSAEPQGPAEDVTCLALPLDVPRKGRTRPSVMQSVTGRGEGLPHLHPLSPAWPQHSVFGNWEGLKGEAQIVLFCAPLKASMPGLTEMSL